MSRRADRLFQIVQMLRGRRLCTAAQLAQHLEVSERTIYRDIRDLSLSGVPIEGEAGIGYRLHADFEAPPLMFSPQEMEALVAGIRLLSAWGGDRLASAALTAQDKLVAALPAQRRATALASRIFAPGFGHPESVRALFDVVHEALSRQHLLALDYIDAQGRQTQRQVQPLGLFFWGGAWLLAAWCELRHDYRSFRLDRCQRVTALEQRFSEQADRSLAGFLRAVQALP